ncbi:MAG: c-type cytochrome [Puia sp.]
MDHFKAALGVKCSFCHAPSKDTAQKWPDFASDDKPEKLIARKMMKMTSKINKKFF